MADNEEGRMLTKSAQPRGINVDMLRVVCMFFIVVLHSYGVVGLLSSIKPLSANWWVCSTFRAIASNASNCYVLISAYFLCMSRFSARKVLSLLLQVFIYSSVLYLLAVSTGIRIFNTEEMLKAFFPVSTAYIWFASCYAAMYILSPFINISIGSMGREKLRNLIVILFVFLSLAPAVTLGHDAFGVARGFSLIWFIFLYYTAAYIRLYVYDMTKESGGGAFKYLCVFVLLILFAVLCRGFAAPPLYRIYGRTPFVLFYGRTAPVFLFASLSIFMFFLRIRVTNGLVSKVVSALTPLVFGIYLFHNHPAVRGFIWNNIFHMKEYANAPYLPFYILFAAVCVYSAGLLIDSLRMRLQGMLENTAVFKKACAALSSAKLISVMESVDKKAAVR